MRKNDEPSIGLDRLGEPIIDPAPDKPPTWEDAPVGKASFKGGNWGMMTGLIIAGYYTSSFGFFHGDVPLVLLLLSGAGLGYILGAVIAGLSVKIVGKSKVPPT